MMLCKKCQNELKKCKLQGGILKICEKCSIRDDEFFLEKKVLGIEKRKININFGCEKKGEEFNVDMRPCQIPVLHLPELYDNDHRITCKCGKYPLHILSNDEGNYAYCAECYEKMFEEK